MAIPDLVFEIEPQNAEPAQVDFSLPDEAPVRFFREPDRATPSPVPYPVPVPIPLLCACADWAAARQPTIEDFYARRSDIAAYLQARTTEDPAVVERIMDHAAYARWGVWLDVMSGKIFGRIFP